MACTKRPFDSEKHAKQAMRKAGFRIRVYWCPEHRSYHVTNNEKRHRAESDGDKYGSRFDRWL